MEDVSKKHVYDYIKRFGFFIIVWEWKMVFDNIIICEQSERKYNMHNFWDVKRYLITRNVYFERQGYKFSHICEMKITLISDRRSITYKYYLNQPKV